MFNEEPMIVSDDNEEELDIYAALGLNTPIEPTVPSNTAQSGFNIDPSDPLAAFMDDDDEDDAEQPMMFGQMSPATVPVQEPPPSLVLSLIDLRPCRRRE